MAEPPRERTGEGYIGLSTYLLTIIGLFALGLSVYGLFQPARALAAGVCLVAAAIAFGSLLRAMLDR